MVSLPINIEESRSVGLILVSAESNEWYTPAGVIEDARQVLGSIDLDPASCAQANETVGATLFYSKENSGLEHEWFGNVWLNPPYGALAKVFTAKLLEEYAAGRVKAGIILVNSNALGAAWGQLLWDFDLVCSPRKRIHFESPDGKVSSSTHGSLIAYIGPDKERFTDVFETYGTLVARASVRLKPPPG